jgi:hypothetical protein
VPDDQDLSLLARLWFAWVCFFRVLLDGGFARRAWSVRQAKTLPVPEPTVPKPSAPVQSDVTPALLLLSLLQREGRLIDFLQQDIATFADVDVGAAARVVHDGCAKALRAHATIEPVRAEEEGARVTLAAGFDADTVKLVGDVKGEPPYTGVLRHRGWRASKLELPRVVGDHDAHVLAPAELELG